MKNILVLLFIAIQSTAALAGIEQIARGNVEHLIIDAPSLANSLNNTPTNRSLKVYLPAGYHQNVTKHYPTVYLLHGYGANNQNWLDIELKETLDLIIHNQLIDEMIVVLPDSSNPVKGSWYHNSQVAGNWQNYITNDVIQYVDTHYRTIADRNQRAISGHSMGGYGTFNIALNRPDISSIYYPMSSALTRTSQLLGPINKTLKKIQQAQPNDMNLFHLSIASIIAPNKNNPPWFVDKKIDAHSLEQFSLFSLFEKNAENLRNTVIKMDVGNKDPLLRSNRQFYKYLLRYDINVEFEVYRGSHTEGLQQRLPATFAFIDRQFKKNSQ